MKDTSELDDFDLLRVYLRYFIFYKMRDITNTNTFNEEIMTFEDFKKSESHKKVFYHQLCYDELPQDEKDIINEEFEKYKFHGKKPFKMIIK